MEMNKITPPHNASLLAAGNGRIGYIDAMRGFAMVMVVWGHLCMFDGAKQGLESIMWHFAMPLFFFISGFVMWRDGKEWRIGDLKAFFIRKTPVLLVFPFLCLCACSVITKQCSIVDALFNNMKMGYWFVLTLFQCNLAFVVLQIFLRRVKRKYVGDVVLYVIAAVLFLAGRVLWKFCGVGSEALTDGTRSIAGLVSWMSFAGSFQWVVCGAIAHKHYAAFTKILSNNVLLVFCILAMVGLSQLGRENAFTSCFSGYCSTFLVLSFFHKHQQSFTSERRLGSLLQYVGRRTLDIYLLHYFFWYTTDFTVLSPYYQHSPVLKFIVTMFFTAVVIALSLLAGNVLRLSSFIAHYGFGAKK